MIVASVVSPQSLVKRICLENFARMLALTGSNVYSITLTWVNQAQHDSVVGNTAASQHQGFGFDPEFGAVGNAFIPGQNDDNKSCCVYSTGCVTVHELIHMEWMYTFDLNEFFSVEKWNTVCGLFIVTESEPSNV